ncbi:MAG: hypothetical protein KJ621_19050 [Proteobacteria bacterium]|nr:hypothetical protein [Pseudomonadota bacterium]
MYIEQFFGTLSTFQIIVAAVALLTGIYTFYKHFLEKARFAIYSGDRMTLVISQGGGCRKFQLGANLVNKAVKTGTLHRLEADVTPPGNTANRYQWRIFVKHKSGTLDREPEADVYPVSLAGKSSKQVFIEFELVDPQVIPDWPPGRYSVKLLGWVNKINRKKRTNLKSEFHFTVSDDLAQYIDKTEPPGPRYKPVDLEEWAPQR